MMLNVFLEIDDSYIEELQKDSILFNEFKNFIVNTLNSKSDIKLFITKGKIQQFQMTFDKILKKGKLEYWQKEEPLTLINDPSTAIMYYRWNFNETAIQLNPYNEVIVEIAKQQIFYKAPCLLLTSYSNEKYGGNNIYVIRDNLTRHPYSSYWEVIKHSTPNLVKDPNDKFINKAFEEWYNGHKAKRIHKANPKHDKDKPIANKGEKVSLLLCNEDEAQKLLNDALDASNSADVFPKYLHNFDTDRKKFIEFKLERITDEQEAIYHGYHIDSITEIDNTKIHDKAIRKQLEAKAKER